MIAFIIARLFDPLFDCPSRKWYNLNIFYSVYLSENNPATADITANEEEIAENDCEVAYIMAMRAIIQKYV